jgi:hypothetical protein
VLTFRSSGHYTFSDSIQNEAHDFTVLHAPLDTRECVLNFLDLGLEFPFDLLATLSFALTLTVHLLHDRFHFHHQAFTRFL